MEEEKNKEVEIRLQDLWAVFVHCWWIMALVALAVGIGLYVFLNATHKDEYTAQASIYVLRSTSNESGSAANISTSDISIATQLVKDCRELIKSRQILERVIYQQNRILTYEQLAKMVKFENEESTRVIYLYVTASDPEEAASLVTTLANVTCDYMNNDMYDGHKLFKAVDQNVVPKKPSNPISKLKIILIAMVCALVVYAVYLVLFLMDDKINTPEDVEQYLGLSLLGQIPNREDFVRRKKYYASDTHNQ